MYKLYIGIFGLAFFLALLLSCTSDEPCPDCPEAESEAALAPISSEGCQCSFNDIPQYDYWLFKNECNDHEKIVMEAITSDLDSCFANVNEEILADVLGMCYKIRQLCREAEGLFTKRLECLQEGQERINILMTSLAGCSSPMCKTLLRALLNRERAKIIECSQYFINESNKVYATVDSMYALFPQKIDNYENQALDCIEEAKDALEDNNVNCVERLELNIIQEGK
jgi:hypothetical protein